MYFPKKGNTRMFPLSLFASFSITFCVDEIDGRDDLRKKKNVCCELDIIGKITLKYTKKLYQTMTYPHFALYRLR